jgi:hypothetical protein
MNVEGEGSKTVTKRISLVEGLKRDKDIHENLDPTMVESFVKHGKLSSQQSHGSQPHEDDKPEPLQLVSPVTEEKRPALPVRKAKNAAVMQPGLIPVNVRVRPDLATALQTASLERQLQGIVPSSKREIIEEALEPWLRVNGYLT